MATPTRSQAVSTPKNPLTSTPNRSNASPRPNTGAFSNRPFAYKSPAVKTPASAHGHSHRISQPTSTPLTAAAIPDELLNLSSPGAAALMASIGQTGLTPLPGVQDGLGITTGITPSQTRDSTTGMARDPGLERVRRLKEVIDILRKGAIGKDVTGLNIEQLAQIHGFETFWDENTIQLAGNTVDLEITFDEARSNVLKTTLKLNMPDEEGQIQENASTILTKDLSKREPDSSSLPWRSLDKFAAHLSYLDHMDHLGSNGNCFQLVGNLYDTFRKIWDEEKKRMKLRHDVQHQCQGNVGLPLKDTDGQLGIRTKYWAKGVSQHQPKPIAEKEDNNSNRDWIAEFTCEKGSPSVPFDHQWLDDEPLLNSLTTENLFHDSQVDKPNWQDPLLKLPEDRATSNAMVSDDTASSQLRMLDVHFVCKLRPAVILPLHIVNNLNNQSNMIVIEQNRAVIFQHILTRLNKNEREQHQAELLNQDRWLRKVDVFSKEGHHEQKNHSYAYYVSGAPWGYSVNQFSFTHPRQYAEMVPLLRQYAVVGTLLSSLGYENKQTTSTSKVEQPQEITSKPTVTRRSNKATKQNKLDLAMRIAKKEENALPIDVRLDVLSDMTKARFQISAPIPIKQASQSASNVSKSRPFIRITVDVRLNGVLEVTEMEGIEFDEDAKKKLSRKLGRVIALSEDIGISMEWLLRELQT